MSLAITGSLLLLSPIQALAEGDITFGQYQSGEMAELPAGESAYTVISVSTEEELAQLAENCQLDAWSRDKCIRLENDISLEEYTDLMIPSFGGIFDGGGHRISNLELIQAGSAQGLFRYVQETGRVQNLEVSGRVFPEGTRSQVGILAGVNYGHRCFQAVRYRFLRRKVYRQSFHCGASNPFLLRLPAHTSRAMRHCFS